MNFTSDTINVIDIGSADYGEGEPAWKKLTTPTRVTKFDPSDPELAKVALWDEACEKKLYKTRFPGCTSLFEPNADVIDLFSTVGCNRGMEGKSLAGMLPNDIPNFYMVGADHVQCEPLDGFKLEADYIKADVQGAEWEVVQGGRKTFRNALVVELEVWFLEFYKKQKLFGEVMSLMNEIGFVLHRLENVGGRPYFPYLTSNETPKAPMSQILWADAVFIRDPADWLDAKDTLKMCQILHDCYHSSDLVAALLKRVRPMDEPAYLGEVAASGISHSCLTMGAVA